MGTPGARIHGKNKHTRPILCEPTILFLTAACCPIEALAYPIPSMLILNQAVAQKNCE